MRRRRLSTWRRRTLTERVEFSFLMRCASSIMMYLCEGMEGMEGMEGKEGKEGGEGDRDD